MRLKEAITNANTGLDAIKRAPVLDYPTDLRCIRIQDISQAKPYEEWAYTETSNDNYKKFKLAKGDILVARTGATVGVSYYVNKDLEAVYNNGTIRLKINEENDSRYIFYITTTKEFRQYIDNVSCVATQPNLRIENLLRFQCPDKDLEEQKAIASVLSAYDDLIEKNNRKIEILQDMAEELYKEWFVRFRFPGYKTAKFTDGIPDVWEVKRCGDISMIKAGGDAPKEYSEKKTDKYKYPIFSNGISEDGLYGYTDKPSIKEESITISARGTVGYVCLRNEPYLPIVRLLVIVPNTEIVSNIFLYMYFKHNATEGYGTSQQQITVPYFKKKKILLPSQELVNRYTEYVEPFFMEIRKLKQLNSNLTIQRDLLLPRLMSGKHAVKVS